MEGIITSDSIVRALHHFDLTIKDLKVIHALELIKREFTVEDDLFDLLDVLKDSYAVIVVDSHKKLAGIVTNYDTTEYFRRRGEDIMWVEDIESMLKKYILAAFQNMNTNSGVSTLEKAMEEITPSDARFKRDFGKALNECFETKTIDDSNMDKVRFEQIFTDHLSPQQPPKPFEMLTLN